MQKLKISAFALIFVLNLFSCKNDEPEFPDPDPISSPPAQPITGSFELQLIESYNGGNAGLVELNSQYKGKGDLNLMSVANLELDHLSFINIANGGVSISGGSFKIWNEGGDELFGAYNYGIKDGERIIISGAVTGGSGNFTGVRGSLKVELHPQNNRNFRALITGHLYEYDPSIAK